MADDRIPEDDLLIADSGEVEVRPDDRVDDERHDEENRLKADYVGAVRDALDAGDKGAVYDLVEPLHAADIADLIELLDRSERAQLATAISDLMTSDVIAELNDYVREDLMEALPAQAVATIAEQLDTDDAVQLIEDLDEDDQRAVMAELEPETREAVSSALAYPEETAGRLMSRHFVAVPEHLTVGDLIDYLREAGDLEHDFFEVFVIDERHHPVGTCALNWILTTPRSVKLTDVMKRDQTLIPVTMDQEEVALMFQKYALISAAVVDESGRLVGQMTVDDIVHIISEEAGEDALLLSGAGDGDINEPIVDSYKARVRWLLANLVTASVASTVIAQFEDVIATMVALAVLMPIVAGIGGNAGTQTLAVTVRAIATNQLTDANTSRAIRRELSIAALNGASIAVVLGSIVAVLFGNPLLGGVIGAAILCNIMIAGIAGVCVPLVLQRLKADPAISSSIFVTMTTDSMGFLVFLSLAVVSGLVG
ncbi:magnesium transporter [Porphyrobacter sp. CACIAM 03H1]|jgi:magnesium transporter|uniref:magnesium transporter n=1 Tax=Porphyrobacter sp. CACIAM 03H1 TaxID=2003315 RepID=UPI000B5A64FB|nr:magnesium transporter [Porphyrobacter sp. CACIAM 03H1]ASJ91773.1 magnesium transporter [Porphyrobacter sp. CACIAM 03H1]